MNKYRGWYNEATYLINALYNEAIEDMVKAGGSNDIKWYITHQLEKTLSYEQKRIMNLTLDTVDWDEISAKATAKVEKEKVA
jgi:hypothetical protein